MKKIIFFIFFIIESVYKVTNFTYFYPPHRFTIRRLILYFTLCSSAEGIWSLRHGRIRSGLRVCAGEHGKRCAVPAAEGTGTVKDHGARRVHGARGDIRVGRFLGARCTVVRGSRGRQCTRAHVSHAARRVRAARGAGRQDGEAQQVWQGGEDRTAHVGGAQGSGGPRQASEGRLAAEAHKRLQGPAQRVSPAREPADPRGARPAAAARQRTLHSTQLHIGPHSSPNTHTTRAANPTANQRRYFKGVCGGFYIHHYIIGIIFNFFFRISHKIVEVNFIWIRAISSSGVPGFNVLYYI